MMNQQQQQLPLKSLFNTKVRVVLSDGSFITGILASTDEKYNVALKGQICDSSLAGTPLEISGNNNESKTVRVIRGENICAVFSA